jgi:hypothetical protein
VILQPVLGGLQHDIAGTLRAEDGTTGTYTATWVENRIPAPAIECGGVTYPSLFTAEAPALTMDVAFPDWGEAVLVATNRVVVYASSRNGSSPAVCDETTSGTYELQITTGPIKQLMAGTWGWAADGRLVFDAAPASPAESPA